MPCRANTAHHRCRISASMPLARATSRDPGTACNTFAQSAMTASLTFASAQAPECDAPNRSRRQRGHVRRCIRRLIGAEHAIQPHELFRAVHLAPRRIDHAIGDAPIHGGQTGRRTIAEIGDLHRSRATRENQHSVVRGVRTEVDEDVDLIVANAPDDCFISIGRNNRPPVIGQVAQLFGDAVRNWHVAVAKDLESLPIVPTKDRLDEISDRMLAEIHRDVPDAQPPLRRAIIHRPRRRSRQRRRQFVCPGLVLRRISCGVKVGW